MIIAITGGRDVQPTITELAQFVLYLDTRGCTVLRHGDCEPPSWVRARGIEGVDQGVARYVADVRPSIVIEAWAARWYPDGRTLDRSAGPRRNRAMLRGDAHKVRDVNVRIGDLAIDAELPRAAALVHWPGGSGTAGCVRLAAGLGIDRVPIDRIVRGMAEPDGA